MLIVIMVGWWSDDIHVELSGRLYSVLDTVVISGEYVCCSAVFVTLVGVSMFSVIWYDLLRTSTISCRLWSSVYECHIVDYTLPSLMRTECGMFVMCRMQCYMSV